RPVGRAPAPRSRLRPRTRAPPASTSRAPPAAVPASPGTARAATARAPPPDGRSFFPPATRGTSRSPPVHRPSPSRDRPPSPAAARHWTALTGQALPSRSRSALPAREILIQRRDAENAEISAEKTWKRLSLCSLRFLCVLCVSALKNIFVTTRTPHPSNRYPSPRTLCR